MISIPTMFLCAVAVYNRVTGKYTVAFIPADWRTFIIFLPVLAFATCVAMATIKKNTIKWRIGAIFNEAPIFLALVASLLLPG
jgi:hypothetical protein